jgi:hypothetical protein
LFRPRLSQIKTAVPPLSATGSARFVAAAAIESGSVTACAVVVRAVPCDGMGSLHWTVAVVPDASTFSSKRSHEIH